MVNSRKEQWNREEGDNVCFFSLCMFVISEFVKREHVFVV